ncbi:MAG: response regulator [Candidatus Dormibacteria bacterium]
MTEARAKVLLVEDDADLADMYRLRLEIARIQVTIARDGDGALEAAASLAPDLVLLDLNLPRRNGLDVIRLLREDPATRHVPLVVLSADSDPDTVAEAEGLGVLAYVMKSSTSPAMLVALVREWLSSRT